MRKTNERESVLSSVVVGSHRGLCLLGLLYTSLGCITLFLTLSRSLCVSLSLSKTLIRSLSSLCYVSSRVACGRWLWDASCACVSVCLSVCLYRCVDCVVRLSPLFACSVVFVVCFGVCVGGCVFGHSWAIRGLVLRRAGGCVSRRHHHCPPLPPPLTGGSHHHHPHTFAHATSVVVAFAHCLSLLSVAYYSLFFGCGVVWVCLLSAYDTRCEYIATHTHTDNPPSPCRISISLRRFASFRVVCHLPIAILRIHLISVH